MIRTPHHVFWWSDEPRHVARVRRGEAHAEFLVGKLEGKNHLENLDVDYRIILKWIFNKGDGAWAGLIWLRTRTGG
jgi:hypothetical protein